jgi:hypothetical protein
MIPKTLFTAFMSISLPSGWGSHPVSTTRDGLAPATVIPTEVRKHGYHTTLGKCDFGDALLGNQHVLSPRSTQDYYINRNADLSVCASTAPSYCYTIFLPSPFLRFISMVERLAPGA